MFPGPNFAGNEQGCREGPKQQKTITIRARSTQIKTRTEMITGARAGYHDRDISAPETGHPRTDTLPRHGVVGAPAVSCGAVFPDGHGGLFESSWAAVDRLDRELGCIRADCGRK